MSNNPSNPKGLFSEFLSREHLIAAGWATVIGVLAFLGGRSVDWLGGPDEVYVINPPTGLDTVIVVHLGDPDSTDQIATRLEAVVREVEALRHQVSLTPPPTIVVAGTDTTVANLLRPNSVALPRFELPARVEGYTLRRAGQFLDWQCPKDGVEQGTVLSILFRVLDEAVIPRATPMFVDVHRRLTERSVYLLFHEQYELRPGWNRIDFVADFEPEEVEVKLGFYLREEVNQKYPPFYRSQCSVTVTPTT